MRNSIAWLFLLTISVVPAYAGHGTIEETDEVIIVEYTGDAADDQPAKKGDAAVPVQQARPSGPAAQLVPPMQPTPPTQPAVVAQEEEVKRARPPRDEEYEARRKARMEKRAARRSKGSGEMPEE